MFSPVSHLLNDEFFDEYDKAPSASDDAANNYQCNNCCVDDAEEGNQSFLFDDDKFLSECEDEDKALSICSSNTQNSHVANILEDPSHNHMANAEVSQWQQHDGSSTDYSSSRSSNTSSSSSKFDQSTQVKKIKNKKESKQGPKKQKRRPIPKPKWNHVKISSSNSYLEIDSANTELELVIEVFKTPTRSNGPQESDKELIENVGDLIISIKDLDTTKTNYLSLKNHLCKAKLEHSYTWIRIGNDGEYLFLYCQSSKKKDVHNFISIRPDLTVTTDKKDLNRYSRFCSSNKLTSEPSWLNTQDAMDTDNATL